MINYKRLTRGIKLLKQHIYDPLTEAADNLTKSGLSIDQYEKENGTFRVTVSVPLTNGDGDTSIPFVLPQTQDFWDQPESVIQGYDLVEITVSQDTRCEPAFITPPPTSAADPQPQGAPLVGQAAEYTIMIKDHEIDPTNYDPFNNEVFTVQVPEIGLLNPYSRLNPFTQSGISVPFRHDRSYLIVLKEWIDSPATAMRDIVSLVISLKFKTRLLPRDTGPQAQNNTVYAGGNYIPQGPTVPAGNSLIEADSNDGVNTGFKLIDSIVDSKLLGGLTRVGRNRFGQNLKFDAGYDVIAVPLFGGWGEVFGGPGTTAGNRDYQSPESLPWCTPGIGNFHTMDRALIPLQYPMVIHHVILAVNNTSLAYRYRTGDGGGAIAGVSLTHEVGVGLMQGVRSDSVRFNQVAFASWTPATIGNYLIDRGDQRRNAAGQHKGSSWDILSCPITVGATGNGSGYVTQGKPFFAAQSDSGTNVRVAPGGVTNGGEQMLDIRWKISDSVTNTSTWTNNENIIGYRGNWVYLICKKTLR